MSRPVSPLLAFAVAALGIAIFSSMDAVMKGLVIGLGAYNALTWRMLAGTVVSGIPYALSRPRMPPRAVLRIHLVRGIVSAIMAFLFFWGLGRVPMAQAIALSFIAPIIALFLAALILKERITRATAIATAMAFAGVLVILWGQARAELGPQAFWGAIAILASAVFYAWNIILMRQQSLVAGAGEVAFFQTIIVTTVYLLAAPWLLVAPPLSEVPALILAAMLATASLFLLSWAYRHAEASYLAPTEYTGFLWATLWGWVVFGERVSLFTVAGAALIVGGCILAARRRDHAPVADSEAQLP
ncbi:DMT family transporter [Sphingomonas koreensis]|uniref:DMT family transporter n=1 Tax=Sphingomonas koreensis TaxID=93064 RepID=A0A1L6JH08_9SPHN|nr:DMT family transporter [Sphingomonas koreensis]APR55219.1 EamA family transporter [Sphingomonas koreensis]MDC7809580.1 DMT family transporter [Sphingomonas koreensis]RSU20499.1 DMT family transporter [Sphingomonas koreensis]RSU28953.1 DMT family transporter [Sphingomonas koreensis]RSU29835.1 DMT family transporter [Sphingomonas koreensis]